MTDTRKQLDARALMLMVLLTALWGFQQVAIKLAAAEVSLLMQAGLRSSIAMVLVLVLARARGVPLFARDGTFWPGLAAGLLFGAEFVFIYGGLAHTSASRMVVFIYLAPPLTALGLHFLVPGERLRAVQWAGVALAFGGLVLAFRDGFTATGGATALGDLCGVAGAALWAATTVLIRATGLARITATKTLFYQLGVSAVVLLAASFAMGEPGVISFGVTAFASLAYQSVIVAFGSYLAWFWLLRHYLAGRLAVFSFLAPMFGVLFGVLILDEPLRASFAGAALLVGAGIVLVNLRHR